MPPPPPPPIDTGVHEHDGFYLRMGIGFGRLGATFTSDYSDELRGSVDGGLAHAAVTGEIAVGGTPAPGLVIGGGVYFSSAPSFSGGREVTTHDLTVNGVHARDLEYDSAGLALIGPFVDYYIDAKLGWHVQAALGLAAINVTEGYRGPTYVTQEHKTGGLGFMVGGGYEWWIGKQWSMGALLRLMYGSTESNKDEAERWSYKALSFPELLFSVTYH